MNIDDVKPKPLLEVIFRIDFNEILSFGLENELKIANFQNKIRKNFPIYNRVEGDLYNFNLPNIETHKIKKYIHIFSNKKYKINLSSSFISLSSILLSEEGGCSYENSKNFISNVKNSLDIFNNNKPIIIRVGLRYVNFFSEKDNNIKYLNDELKTYPIGIKEDKVNNSTYQINTKSDENLMINSIIKYGKQMITIDNKNSKWGIILDIDSSTINIPNNENLKGKIPSELFVILHEIHENILNKCLKEVNN